MAKPQVIFGDGATQFLRPVAVACRCTIRVRVQGPLFIYAQLGIVGDRRA